MSSFKQQAKNCESPAKFGISPAKKVQKMSVLQSVDKDFAISAQKELVKDEDFETIIKVDKKTEEKIRKLKWQSQSTTKKQKPSVEKNKTPTISQLDGPESITQIPNPIDQPPRPLEQSTQFFRTSQKTFQQQNSVVRLNKNWNNRLKCAS